MSHIQNFKVSIESNEDWSCDNLSELIESWGGEDIIVKVKKDVL